MFSRRPEEALKVPQLPSWEGGTGLNYRILGPLERLRAASVRVAAKILENIPPTRSMTSKLITTRKSTSFQGFSDSMTSNYTPVLKVTMEKVRGGGRFDAKRLCLRTAVRSPLFLASAGPAFIVNGCRSNGRSPLSLPSSLASGRRFAWGDLTNQIRILCLPRLPPILLCQCVGRFQSRARLVDGGPSRCSACA